MPQRKTCHVHDEDEGQVLQEPTDEGCNNVFHIALEDTFRPMWKCDKVIDFSKYQEKSSQS